MSCSLGASGLGRVAICSRDTALVSGLVVEGKLSNNPQSTHEKLFPLFIYLEPEKAKPLTELRFPLHLFIFLVAFSVPCPSLILGLE